MTLEEWKKELEKQGISGDEWYLLLADWERDRNQLQLQINRLTAVLRRVSEDSQALLDETDQVDTRKVGDDE